MCASAIKASLGDGFITKAFLVSLMLLGVSNLYAETPAPSNTLTHTFNAFTLEINNENKQCQLEAKNASESEEPKTIPLLLEAPCYWIVENDNKSLLNYSYEDASVDHLLLVAGTALDWPDEKKAYLKLPENTYCSQHLQGIVIQKSQVYAVNEKMDAAHCETGLSIDEKVFYALAHNPERYQETPPKVAEQPIQSQRNTEAITEPQPKDTEGKSFFNSVKEFFTGINDKAN